MITKYYIRRVSIFLVTILCGILLIAIPFLGFDIVGIITIMIIVNAGSSCAVPGVFANHADLAPNFAGKLIEQMPPLICSTRNNLI